MPLESATFVSDLDATNPPGSDSRSQSDDHHRLVKSALRNTFPNASKAFRFPSASVKTGDYTATSSDQNAALLFDTSGGSRQLTLPSLAAGDAGWLARVQKITTDANTLTINGTINGTSGLVIDDPFSAVVLIWSGSAWYAMSAPNFTGAGFEFTYIDAGAAAGPEISLFRDSASPAASDFIGALTLKGRNSAAAKVTYAQLLAQIIDATNGSEDANLLLKAMVAGVLQNIISTSGLNVSLAGALAVANGLTVTAGGLTVSAGPVDFPAASIAGADLAADAKVFAVQRYHARDEVTSGTASQGSLTSATWNTRRIQTEVLDDIGGSIASNQIVLPAGTYYAEIHAVVFYNNNTQLANHQLRLRNVSDSTTLLLGMPAQTSQAGNATEPVQERLMYMGGWFTVGASKNLEVQHWPSSSGATGGTPVSSGEDEVYLDAKFWKVA